MPNEVTAKLVSTFEHIWRNRMADVPILNPNLSVQAVGFRMTDGRWTGVLITPWFMNLLLLPADGELPASTPGDPVLVNLPGGEMPFLLANEPGIGEYAMCSLFSPVMEFADMDAAVATAEAVLALMFPATTPEETVSAEPVAMSRRRLFGFSR
ncbi:[NiFe]-hydrogenase assembly chaperone HybE [Leeia sp. TBRC 13508]|uniref:[NiFe]-hydrogenase assembly chaperone HybE n=1 Tax=Leeia speluncae TaxID=2884804 RepID=A0ABS8D2G0_9NEIS|nr:[NiFe]-hydrogenase assembly chaperone HybE [Leeia speluncae]MCB6182385.1 [NiFe]-hydrogenase assembly chaperone HybE [Leeia speluncae]